MDNIVIAVALIVAVTIHDIIQTVSQHIDAKDRIKILKAEEAAHEAAKYAATMKEMNNESEKELHEMRISHAKIIESFSPEQLATYNKTLEQLSQPKFVCVPAEQPYSITNPFFNSSIQRRYGGC